MIRRLLRKLRRPARVDLFRVVTIDGQRLRVTQIVYDCNGAHLDLEREDRWITRNHQP